MIYPCEQKHLGWGEGLNSRPLVVWYLWQKRYKWEIAVNFTRKPGILSRLYIVQFDLRGKSQRVGRCTSPVLAEPCHSSRRTWTRWGCPYHTGLTACDWRQHDDCLRPTMMTTSRGQPVSLCVCVCVCVCVCICMWTETGRWSSQCVDHTTLYQVAWLPGAVSRGGGGGGDPQGQRYRLHLFTFMCMRKRSKVHCLCSAPVQNTDIFWLIYNHRWSDRKWGTKYTVCEVHMWTARIVIVYHLFWQVYRQRDTCKKLEKIFWRCSILIKNRN